MLIVCQDAGLWNDGTSVRRSEARCYWYSLRSSLTHTTIMVSRDQVVEKTLEQTKSCNLIGLDLDFHEYAEGMNLIEDMEKATMLWLY